MSRIKLQSLIKEGLEPPYFDRLGQALDAVEEFMAKKQIVLDPVEHEEGVRQPFMYDGIPYGQTKDAHYKIQTMKGRNTRKYLHVVIYRMETGRYELVVYAG